MKSLIILRGLSKFEKDSWLKRERLLNFLVDIEAFKRLYYKPEYKGGRDFLVRSLDDLIYRRTIGLRLGIRFNCSYRTVS